MPVIFSSGGLPDSFGKLRFPADLPAYLAKFSLNGFEIECGRGVNISEKTYSLLPKTAKEHNIYLSLHAPYFISISSVEEETRKKSVLYIAESAKAASRLGITRIVVHSGSCSKISRADAAGLALETLKESRAALDGAGFHNISICPETMGKVNQLGTLDEVLELCSFDERMLPCVDFGHLNARTHGEIRSQKDYADIFDRISDKLGNERLKNLHIHFSKIEYTVGGEKKHLTFDDTRFGPDYEPLLDEIAKRGIEPVIVCESDGTQAEDCADMANYYSSIA